MKFISVPHLVVGIGFIMLGTAVLLPSQPKSVQMSNRFDRIAAGLEAYALDNNGAYPPNTNDFYFHSIITTPIAYLAPEDLWNPFPTSVGIPILNYINIDQTIGNSQFPAQRDHYPYYLERHGHWIIWCGRISSTDPETNRTFDFMNYDPTNGTLRSSFEFGSYSGAFRSQKMTLETGHY